MNTTQIIQILMLILSYAKKTTKIPISIVIVIVRIIFDYLGDAPTTNKFFNNFISPSSSSNPNANPGTTSNKSLYNTGGFSQADNVNPFKNSKKYQITLFKLFQI